MIYILADDLGYGDLSCYGNKKLKTPNIDRLASEGLKFTEHYSANTVCTPSRHSLMSGQHAGHALARGNGDEGKLALPEKLTVLPEVFKAAGYRTGMFGKWGLGETHVKGNESPLSHGFDEFTAWKSQRIAHTYYPSSIVKGNRDSSGESVVNEEALEKGTYIHDLIMNDALAFIEKNIRSKQAYFCYIPTAIPHAAMHAPKDLHEKYRKVFPEFDKKIGKYGAGPGESCPDVQNPIAGYAGMMENLDNQIGQLLLLLEKRGELENTVIFFSSDNGSHLEGGHNPKFWDSNGPLRGHKRDLYEGGIRAPFMAYWPETIKAGGLSDHRSAQYDMLATICDLLGEPVPAQNDGVSLLATLTGKGEQEEHEYLYWEFHRGDVLDAKAVREGDWKLVIKQPRAGKKKNKTIGKVSVELFNLKEDLGETKNVAKENSEVVDRLRAFADEAHTPLR